MVNTWFCDFVRLLTIIFLEFALARGGALIACLALVTGCLVTESAQIPDEDNLPPSIVSGDSARTMGRALDQIIEVDLAEFDEGSELTIPVIVRDPNLTQTLQYNAYVDFEGNPGGTLIREGTIMPSGEADCGAPLCLERLFNLNVPITELAPAGFCHKIELLVSSQFSGGASFRQGLDPVDIAQAVWWVRTTDSRDSTFIVEMSTCPRI